MKWTGRKLRTATVGCGRIGVESSAGMADFAPAHLASLGHLQSIEALDFASELAACDENDQALSKVEGRFGVTHTYNNIHQLLSEFKPELLTIATRTPDKYSIFMEALDNGVRAVHIEKPLCNKPAELSAYATIFRRSDIFVTSGCLRRFLAPFQNIKSFLDGQKQQSAQHISVSQGLASLMWTQFHSIDLILFLAGLRTPLAVQASLGPLEYSSDLVLENDPLLYSATIIFDDGMIGEISAKPGHTTTAYSGNSGIELKADGRQAYQVFQHPDDDPYLTTKEVETEGGDLAGMQGPLNCLARAALGDQDNMDLARATARDFIMSQKIAFAFIESQRQGGKIVDLAGFEPDVTCWGKTAGRFA